MHEPQPIGPLTPDQFRRIREIFESARDRSASRHRRTRSARRLHLGAAGGITPPLRLGAVPGRTRIVDLYLGAAGAAPGLGLFQLDHAYDREQRMRYFIHFGEPDAEVFAALRANRREIGAAVPRFRWFTAGGPDHGLMPDARFYSYNTEGHRLRDWVAAIAGGDVISNVECTGCSRPGLQFSDFDVHLLHKPPATARRRAETG